MFSGIITNVGEVAACNGDAFVITSNYDANSIEIGASIACSGCCLTVTDVRTHNGGAAFTVDVSNETRSKTNLGEWKIGTKVNLERSLKLGDEMGGHIVTGHIDGLAHISDIYADGDCQRFVFEAPEHLALYIAPKGSIAINGTSLTINEVAGQAFGINFIPHSLSMTTWGVQEIGTAVNIEVDLFARYVARLLEYRQ
ncbi:MAG: riboflavin synthase [Hyphomicrobiaceae bacterium]|nr:riboflavin synthase [Hyphomicrobiaceae bacterium]